ncbi:MAG: SDR family NAD(P)-dependent oxidoreductase [Acidimicrobiia bacterium]|nr:SDR family NAD(P)-dependent oxidoreductase [Acidimicrobiia bacterium]
MSSPTVLIIGASRGIGLEFVEQYAEAGWTVHATTRSPDNPGALGQVPGAVRIHGFDVTDDPRPLVRDVGVVDVLIHNAGVGRGTPRDQMMEINAVAPIRVVRAFLEAGSPGPGGKVMIVTSQLGARRGSTESLGDYGDSKAALNDEFRARAEAWADFGVVAIVVHPGWVRTDMGGQSAPLSVEESVSEMCSLIAGLDSSHHGGFWNWDGREHDW